MKTRKPTKREKIEIALTVVFMLAAFTICFWPQSEAADHSCCATAAQGPDEPGNPDHTEPAQPCATNPTGKQVGCKCAKHRGCDGDGNVIESPVCKSYCYKHKCTCPSPPCP